MLPARTQAALTPARYCGGRMMRERAGPRFFEDFFFAAFFLPALRFFIAMNRLLRVSHRFHYYTRRRR